MIADELRAHHKRALKQLERHRCTTVRRKLPFEEQKAVYERKHRFIVLMIRGFAENRKVSLDIVKSACFGKMQIRYMRKLWWPFTAILKDDCTDTHHDATDDTALELQAATTSTRSSQLQ
ncbi:hypothetical protein PoB_006538400 [Plakobranchus ocellatus]|uniref:Uncharacterized protein n=1 Tax=Plakobranchus ocellatus TaxID=259542 RepID=A0AAV4D403_9GAST|nr:hypothetical protein PoB_006538400 [Plakobranchus ocellatus]